MVAEPSRWPTMGRDAVRKVKPPALSITAVRVSDGKRVTIAIASTPTQFRRSAESTSVQGFLFEGVWGVFDPNGMQMLSGAILFQEAGLKDGAPVRGTLQLKILRMKGRLF